MNYTNMGLEEAVSTLKTLQEKKLDLVVSPKNLEMVQGEVFIKQGQDLFSPTEIVDPNNHMSRQLSAKMDIPWKYYEKMMGLKKDLLSENVNAWLKDKQKNFLVRMYQHEDTTRVVPFYQTDFLR